MTGSPPVRAAGGVVTRRGAGGACEVLVVHRPRYDDWSLPKGKLEPGETPQAAAVREIEEETGVRVRLGRPLPDTEYVDRNGRPKVVHYWEMTVESTAPRAPDQEVDESRWIGPAEAATLLTYDHDRRLVASVCETPHGGPA